MLKITIFSDPTAFDAPVGTLPYRLVWETGMVGLRDCEKSLRICLAALTQYLHLADRRTDGRTDRHLAPTQSALCSRFTSS